MNSFLIVTPFRNAEASIADAATRSLEQLYDRYRIVFVDDASSDSGSDALKKVIDSTKTHCRDVRLVDNRRPIGLLASLHSAILNHGAPEDIIVFLPSCDSLLHADALTVVDAAFERDESWMTYGGAVWKPMDRRPFQSSSYTDSEIRELRVPHWESGRSVLSKWKVQPLLAFRFQLYRRLGCLDPTWSFLKSQNGECLDSAADAAIAVPLLESAGAKRITHLRAKVCIHRSTPTLPESRKRLSELRAVFAKPSFPQLNSLDQATTQRAIAPSFVRPPRSAVGNGIHVSGWPYARECLQGVRCTQSVVIDDFVEQSFCYGARPPQHDRPWIGIFHHPPNVPEFAYRQHRLQTIFQLRSWRDRVSSLRGCITLSEHLASFLRQELNLPAVAVKHPSGPPKASWHEGRFLSRRKRSLAQVGFYLRNTRAIYQLPEITGVQKSRLISREPWVNSYDARVKEYWTRMGVRREYGGVEDLGFVDRDRYEELLTESVVLTEVFDASANNVVIESILRSTPLIVNRHPAVTEYLGADYPLYFDDFQQVPELLETERVVDAHRYLQDLEKRPFTGKFFTDSVSVAIDKIMAAESIATETEHAEA